MKLIKNQLGITHVLPLFLIVFVGIGLAGLAVSQAQTSSKIKVSGSVSINQSPCKKEGNNDCKDKPYTSFKGIVYEKSKNKTASAKEESLKLKTFTTDKQGKFTIILSPGTYIFEQDSAVSIDSGKNGQPTCESKTVAVKKGSNTDVKIKCRLTASETSEIPRD